MFERRLIYSVRCPIKLGIGDGCQIPTVRFEPVWWIRLESNQHPVRPNTDLQSAAAEANICLLSIIWWAECSWYRWLALERQRLRCVAIEDFPVLEFTPLLSPLRLGAHCMVVRLSVSLDGAASIAARLL